MADEDQDRNDNVEAAGDLSRREFVTLSVAAGIAMAAGAASGAELPVIETDVEVKTPDGTCDAVFIHPTTGSHPGVLIWPDAFGLRPAMRDIGKRMAAEGYSVLVPNPFYRVGQGAGARRSVDVQLPEPGRHGEAAAADGRRSTPPARPRRTRRRSSRSSTRSRR